MKNLLFLFGLFFGVLLLFPTESHAQWQPDVRLTNDPAVSYTSENTWCIAASGPVVHVVWNDFRDGNLEIYSKRSSDGGVSWGADMRLTNNSYDSQSPSVAVSGTTVHVVWHDSRDGAPLIYYKRSTDGGANWAIDTRLTNIPAFSVNPSVSASGQAVHVVWVDQRDGNYEIYSKRSIDGGASWDMDTRLTNDIFVSQAASVAVSGQVVLVVWEDGRNGEKEIYYKRSVDGGVSWGADLRLTNNPVASEGPSVAVSGAVVHVVWYDNRDGNNEIYHKRSTDGGVSWGADTRLTNNSLSSELPSVSASGAVVHVVWHDYRDGSPEIYDNRSTDGGASWGTDTRLTNNSAFSYLPSVSVSDSAVHVAWQDNRDGNYEIYYKRDPTGSVTDVRDIELDVPKEFSLSQNYPNPFNPTTVVQFSLPRSESVTLKVFSILGEDIATLVSSVLSAGTYRVDWNAQGFPGGIYFYRLQAGAFIQTRKLILLR